MTQIVLINPKSPTNVGGVMRAAGCYQVDHVWYTGNRYGYARKFVTDTKQIAGSIPLDKIDDLTQLKAQGLTLVAVELVDGAVPLPKFTHPEHAAYIFGPEDGSISQEVLNLCDHVVYVPTIGCMNLAATANVALYDRLAKSQNTDYSRDFLLQNRDNNNRVKV